MKPGLPQRTLKWGLYGAIPLVLIFLLGPRASTDVVVGENDLPAISGLSLYLEKSEKEFSHLVPETRKRIAWAGEENTVTPISFVYLHGFSDSNRVQGDSIDRIAAKFGANVFYTRYAGHGYKNKPGIEALGNATLQQWADDSIEALRIGRLIGRKVVVVGFSTGAPLGTWASTQEEAPDALIMVSPNFGLRDWTSEFALGPWGKVIVRMAMKKEHCYKITPEGIHGEYTTWKYNSKAIVTMMSAVKLGRESDLSKITSPVLAVYSEEDKIISPGKFREVMNKMGSSVKEQVAITSSTGHPGEENHILMGLVASNKNATHEAETAIIDFVRKHVTGGAPKKNAGNMKAGTGLSQETTRPALTDSNLTPIQ